MKLDSDYLMENVFHLLQVDFQHEIGELSSLTREDVRSYSHKIGWTNHYTLKCKTQIVSWLKRYRFKRDLFNDDELETRTNEKFLADQLRIGQSFRSPSYRARLVIQRARKIVKDTLGPYRDDDVYRYGEFSQKATVGFTDEDVYLDRKICPGSPLSGTPAEIKWLSHYLKSDQLLHDNLCDDKGRVHFSSVFSLKQVNVPKTALIHRAVRPNTLIGSFRSLGLGTLITKRIKEHLGINLAYLQSKHQAWARKGSRTMVNATADLSSASDSFTPELVNMLLPRPWYNALKLGRTPYVELDGDVLYSPSFMAMGIGYTFPIMTLMFYALLLSLQSFTQIRGNISVFGDDLIYPRGLHLYVLKLFSDLGFVINVDKTFVSVPFRESCGGDYYDGFDVRPASPKGVRVVLEGETSIAAYVYKLFNSLIRRWDEVEIPRTLRFLRQVLNNFSITPCFVPSHFPDHSGFKDGSWRRHMRGEVFTENRRKPFYCGYVIPCLQQKTSLRPVGHMAIYYWERLQHAEQDIDNPNPYASERDVLVWKYKKFKSDRDPKRSYRKLVAFSTRRGNIMFFDLAQKPFNG